MVSSSRVACFLCRVKLNGAIVVTQSFISWTKCHNGQPYSWCWMNKARARTGPPLLDVYVRGGLCCILHMWPFSTTHDKLSLNSAFESKTNDLFLNAHYYTYIDQVQTRWSCPSFFFIQHCTMVQFANVTLTGWTRRSYQKVGLICWLDGKHQ